jgi:uncharacterized protein
MRLTEVTYNDAQPVEGYGEGFFRIGGKVHEGPILTGADGTRFWGGFEDREPLLALAGEVDVLFIGTGAEIAHIPADLRKALEGVGIGVEIMNSPSAARTYNVLLSEGRRIALAMVPV